VPLADASQLIYGYIPYPSDLYKDAATAEAAGIWHSGWYQTGVPGAGAAPTGALNGATFTYSVGLAGAIAVPAAVAGRSIYLARMEASQAGNVGTVALVDRIWGNVPVVTTTGAQAIVSPTWPSRDAAASTLGERVRLALECSAATTNAGAITNTTVSYTNSQGTAGRTATLTSYPATAAVGTWVEFSLQAGDTGVRSVQSVTLGTSYVSGAVHLVAFRLIARMPMPAANTGADRGPFDLALPNVWDASVLCPLWLPQGTALGAVTGSVNFTQY
jgi:hypothetical protein